MTRKLTPEEKRRRKEQRKQKQENPAPPTGAKEKTMDTQNNEPTAPPEVMNPDPPPEGELKVEAVTPDGEEECPECNGSGTGEDTGETDHCLKCDGTGTVPTAPDQKPDAPPVRKTEGANGDGKTGVFPPGIPSKPNSTPEARLIAAAAALRREHRRNNGTGYPRIFIDNVCRALDALEAQNAPPEEGDNGQ